MLRWDSCGGHGLGWLWRAPSCSQPASIAWQGEKNHMEKLLQWERALTRHHHGQDTALGNNNLINYNYKWVVRGKVKPQ